MHLELFPEIPAEWRDDALAAKWEKIREVRRWATVNLEKMRQDGRIGASLQAKVTLHSPEHAALLPDEAAWAEVLIVSAGRVRRPAWRDRRRDRAWPRAANARAAGACCRRSARTRRHPALCRRCVDAVESGLVCRAAG